MVTIDREHLISEKQNNKASAEGARLPKEAIVLRDIFKFTKPSVDAFHPFGLISRACQGPRESELESATKSSDCTALVLMNVCSLVSIKNTCFNFFHE